MRAVGCRCLERQAAGGQDPHRASFIKSPGFLPPPTCPPVFPLRLLVIPVRGAALPQQVLHQERGPAKLELGKPRHRSCHTQSPRPPAVHRLTGELRVRGKGSVRRVCLRSGLAELEGTPESKSNPLFLPPLLAVETGPERAERKDRSPRSLSSAG